jgi:hypothetical protein
MYEALSHLPPKKSGVRLIGRIEECDLPPRICMSWSAGHLTHDGSPESGPRGNGDLKRTSLSAVQSRPLGRSPAWHPRCARYESSAAAIASSCLREFCSLSCHLMTSGPGCTGVIAIPSPRSDVADQSDPYDRGNAANKRIRLRSPQSNEYKRVKWSHPPGSNRRPADYETISQRIISNLAVGKIVIHCCALLPVIKHLAAKRAERLAMARNTSMQGVGTKLGTVKRGEAGVKGSPHLLNIAMYAYSF